MKNKYSEIYKSLHKSIIDEYYKPGDRLPSEVDLADQFNSSRPTVARAINDLERIGLLFRKAGSGTYVNFNSKAAGILSFGILIANTAESEIFEAIYSSIAGLSEHKNFNLMLYGSPNDKSDSFRDEVSRLVERCASQKIAGIFFVPARMKNKSDRFNLEIADSFSRQGISMVLIDRDAVPFPERSNYDLVGIDNIRAGYIMTKHLLDHSCGTVDFLTKPMLAETSLLRHAGYRLAIEEHGLKPEHDRVHIGNPADADFIKSIIAAKRPDAVLCSNDVEAAELMSSLDNMGITAGKDILIAGFDDVRYAEHLRVPLTTYHMPCVEIGAIAVDTMLSRIKEPKAAPRHIMAEGYPVFRRSTQTCD
jgi:DNA-binding LacI/PurR family transcriptional regulator